MSDARIPVAIDPDGHYVPIEEAEAGRTNYYRCPECGDFLNPFKRGSVQIDHFRHRKGALQEHQCRLAVQSHIDAMVEEFRRSEAEKAERAKQIQVFLSRRYETVLNLVGRLPSVSWGEFDDAMDLTEALGELEFSSDGVLKDLRSSWFHPKEGPDVMLPLDPGSEVYRVDIEGSSGVLPLVGTWEADPLSSGDVFVGEPRRARRVSTKAHVKEGDWVFVILEEAPDPVPGRADLLHLGDWTVLAFLVSPDTVDLLEEWVGVSEADKHAFYGDIILPAYADPATEDAVLGPPEAEALVAIIPPAGTDPEFEIVSVPMMKDQITTVEPAGIDEPRLVRLDFPETGTRRLNIHWTNRQRLIQLHTSPDEKEPPSLDLGQPELGVWVRTGADQRTFLDPIRGPFSATVPKQICAEAKPDFIDFEAPEGLRLDLHVTYQDREDLPPSVMREGLTLEATQSQLPGYLSQGCRELGLRFEALGRLKVVLEEEKPWQREISDKEIRERIEELDELPKKARWPLVRHVMRAPPGTLHAEFPSGIKKRVRRQFMLIREERGREDGDTE